MTTATPLQGRQPLTGLDALTQTTTDTPIPMSGQNTYTIQPVNDERTFNGAAKETAINVLVGEQEEPAPSSGLGIVLGGVLMLTMISIQILTARGGGRR